MDSSETNEPGVDHGSISLLIGPCREGDATAREKLLQEMKEYLEVTANRHMDHNLKQKIGSSDIVQQSFLKVIENFEQFRGGSQGEFRAWLKTIVINEMNRIRRAYRTDKRDVTREKSVHPQNSTAPGVVPENAALTPSSEALQRERREKFYEALAQLTPEYAEVIQLRNIDRLTFSEIGEKMDRTEDAASKLWYRAIVRFEEKLKSSGDFDEG